LRVELLVFRNVLWNLAADLVVQSHFLSLLVFYKECPVLHQLLKLGKESVALLHQLVYEQLYALDNFLLLRLTKVRIALLEYIVFEIIDSVKFLEMIHQIA
jgi:hypothetical protein